MYCPRENPAVLGKRESQRRFAVVAQSRHYVDGLIETGEAIYLSTGAAQLTVWRASLSPDARQFRAGVGDWFTSDCSALPGGQLLRITTRQLAT
jgi:hypothetical protein